MIASEFRSRARPLKTATRAAGYAIGDSVLYHSLLELASLKRFRAPARNRDYRHVKLSPWRSLFVRVGRHSPKISDAPRFGPDSGIWS